MVLEKLGESLKATLSKIAGSLFIDEKLINELVKDIQRSLLQADVNVKLVLELTERIKERSLKEQPAGLSKKEHVVHVVYEELTRFMGGETGDLKLPDKKPAIVMLVGLYGSGKTTTAGKLAKYLMKRGKRVALLGLDVHRPAAMDQLAQVEKGVNAHVFVSKDEKDPVAIYRGFQTELAGFDVVIADTAGRDALSQDLIDEIRSVADELKPDTSILVISADIGQAAMAQAKAFHESAGITGVIITKMDGTAKGGGALSACAVTGSPVTFIGVGEKADDLEPFNPKGFVGRLLGMGDLEALLEKAKDAISEEDAKDMEKKFLKGEFNLMDLYQQMEAMSKMGSLSKLMELIPGMGQLHLPKEALQVQEGKLKKWRHAMNSMTKPELEDPEVIDAKRIERISKGSGISTNDVRDMLKQYRQSKKLVKALKGSADNPEKLMKQFSSGKLRMK